jgi:hypothetical protein
LRGLAAAFTEQSGLSTPQAGSRAPGQSGATQPCQKLRNSSQIVATKDRPIELVSWRNVADQRGNRPVMQSLGWPIGIGTPYFNTGQLTAPETFNQDQVHLGHCGKHVAKRRTDFPRTLKEHCSGIRDQQCLERAGLLVAVGVLPRDVDCQIVMAVLDR